MVREVSYYWIQSNAIRGYLKEIITELVHVSQLRRLKSEFLLVIAFSFEIKINQENIHVKTLDSSFSDFSWESTKSQPTITSRHVNWRYIDFEIPCSCHYKDYPYSWTPQSCWSAPLFRWWRTTCLIMFGSSNHETVTWNQTIVFSGKRIVFQSPFWRIQSCFKQANKIKQVSCWVLSGPSRIY